MHSGHDADVIKRSNKGGSKATTLDHIIIAARKLHEVNKLPIEGGQVEKVVTDYVVDSIVEMLRRILGLKSNLFVFDETQTEVFNSCVDIFVEMVIQNIQAAYDNRLTPKNFAINFPKYTIRTLSVQVIDASKTVLGEINANHYKLLFDAAQNHFSNAGVTIVSKVTNQLKIPVLVDEFIQKADEANKIKQHTKDAYEWKEELDKKFDLMLLVDDPIQHYKTKFEDAIEECSGFDDKQLTGKRSDKNPSSSGSSCSSAVSIKLSGNEDSTVSGDSNEVDIIKQQAKEADKSKKQQYGELELTKLSDNNIEAPPEHENFSLARDSSESNVEEIPKKKPEFIYPSHDVFLNYTQKLKSLAQLELDTDADKTQKISFLPINCPDADCTMICFVSDYIKHIATDHNTIPIQRCESTDTVNFYVHPLTNAKPKIKFALLIETRINSFECYPLEKTTWPILIMSQLMPQLPSFVIIWATGVVPLDAKTYVTISTKACKYMPQKVITTAVVDLHHTQNVSNIISNGHALILAALLNGINFHIEAKNQLVYEYFTIDKNNFFKNIKVPDHECIQEWT